MEKFNETKSYFFEKINKIDKPLGKERGPKSEVQKKVQQTSQKFKRIISDYYEQSYANKMDNLEEMNKFLEVYNNTRLNLAQIQNMNRQMTSDEIESATENSQQTKVQDQTVSQMNSTKHLTN